MFVGHVHEVVPEGGVVVVLDPTWGKLARDDAYVGLGEVGAPVPLEMLGHSRCTSKADDGARDVGRGRHAVVFQRNSHEQIFVCRVSSNSVLLLSCTSFAKNTLNSAYALRMTNGL